MTNKTIVTMKPLNAPAAESAKFELFGDFGGGDSQLPVLDFDMDLTESGEVSPDWTCTPRFSLSVDEVKELVRKSPIVIAKLHDKNDSNVYTLTTAFVSTYNQSSVNFANGFSLLAAGGKPYPMSVFYDEYDKGWHYINPFNLPEEDAEGE